MLNAFASATLTAYDKLCFLISAPWCLPRARRTSRVSLTGDSLITMLCPFVSVKFKSKADTINQPLPDARLHQAYLVKMYVSSGASSGPHSITRLTTPARRISCSVRSTSAVLTSRQSRQIRPQVRGESPAKLGLSTRIRFSNLCHNPASWGRISNFLLGDFGIFDTPEMLKNRAGFFSYTRCPFQGRSISYVMVVCDLLLFAGFCKVFTCVRVDHH